MRHSYCVMILPFENLPAGNLFPTMISCLFRDIGADNSIKIDPGM